MKDRVLTNPVAHDQFWSMLRSEWLQWRLNRTPLWRIRKRNRLLWRLFASVDGPVFTVQLPFHAALGNKTHIGKNFFANHNCMIYDREEVYIGDNVLLGPNVIITTIAHPMEAEERFVSYSPDSFEPHKRASMESNAPITIGNNVWIAAGAIICPGVTIGDNTVIGAGSVVTRDIPDHVFACGVPCRAVRAISKGKTAF